MVVLVLWQSDLGAVEICKPPNVFLPGGDRWLQRMHRNVVCRTTASGFNRFTHRGTPPYVLK